MLNLGELQRRVIDKGQFESLENFYDIGASFIKLLAETKPTKITSPTPPHNYIFYQFGEEFGHKITRPLNGNLFTANSDQFKNEYEIFLSLINDLKKYESGAADLPKHREFIVSDGLNRVIYTIQQSIGSIGDSFENENQSRKRIGQLFEKMILLILKELSLECESRTIKIPLPNHSEFAMSYELDLVFSRGKAIVATENALIQPHEIVGSVKTTSKDRMDKIFLDKFMISRLIGHDVSLIAIFLHDVQRAKKAENDFGINSTFKTNHFLGYSLALNRLDGVYYVDPLPSMIAQEKLRNEIRNFSQFLLYDIWSLTSI